MLCDREGARCITLPGFGQLIVSTDLHGNNEDFETLRDLYRRRRQAERDVFWLILGDTVHAPDARARSNEPRLYDYPDASAQIVAELARMRRAEPDHVILLLGNHEHAHIGGLRTSKFYPDEAAQLEAELDPMAREQLRALFRAAPLIAVAPCGMVFCHGSPDEQLCSLEQLVGIDYDVQALDERQRELLHSCLNSYGQPAEVTRRVLAGLSRCCGFELQVLVHGHDRDEAGWFAEGGNQLCPVLFGAPRENKRYLELDLGQRYHQLDAIRDGIELRRLYVD
jgi:hypothetical protein